MSQVLYLIGAGASYGQRGKNKMGEILPGYIERGLPVVNQLEAAIEWYCKKLRQTGPEGTPRDKSDYPNLYGELKWLKEKCQTYPTIDTYAKKLTVTGDWRELHRLKRALSSFFVLIQSHQKRDLRYDGFIASIIQDDGSLPNNISVLSWNYDYQMEYVLQDFSPITTDILHIWQNQGITCKGFGSFIDNSRFNCVKLNGTAMFSIIQGNKLIDPSSYDPSRIEKWYEEDFRSWKSNISFAWEKDDSFVDSVLPLVKDAKVLVVIGYSFPFVNRAVDRKLIQNMDALKTVYIQDTAANDVKQSFETLLSENQRKGLTQRLLQIHPRTSVSQFIIPNELT